MSQQEEKSQFSNPGMKVHFNEIVGGVLRHERTMKGLNQADAAKNAGLPTSTWSRLEAGISGMSVDQLLQASSALEIDPEDLVGEIVRVREHLTRRGVEVVRPTRGGARPTRGGAKPGETAAWFLGGAAIGGLIAALVTMDGRKHKP